jgi:hypothetical protein
MLKLILIFLFFLSDLVTFSQFKNFQFDEEKAKNNKNVPQREAQWTNNRISDEERNKTIALVGLSQPASAQILMGFSYLVFK